MIRPATARLAAIQRRRIAFWDAIHDWQEGARRKGDRSRIDWASLRFLYARTRPIVESFT